MDDQQYLPPPKKHKPLSQIGCLSCLERLPLGPNPVPRLQLILYVLSVIFGLFVCIPMGIELRRFTGNCILWTQVVWDGRTLWPWAETSCDYLIYMNLSVNVIFGTLMILFMSLFIHPRYEEEDVRKVRHLTTLFKYSSNFVTSGMNILMLCVHFVIWCAQLAGAIVLNVGLKETCRWLEESLRHTDHPYTCAEASYKLNWSEYRIIKAEGENDARGYGFYGALVLALLFSWLLVFIWSLQLMLNIGLIFTRCSCEIAEEKVKISASSLIAARRSRMATPIGTPGGRHTPVPIGQPMAPPFRSMGSGPAPQSSEMGQLQPLRYPSKSTSSEA